MLATPAIMGKIKVSPEAQNYIGRFAPSPTGPLHLGSLYTALASFLDAKAQQGKWLLRIDDLDHFRNAFGAANSIIETLRIYGLHADAPVLYQSQQPKNYAAIIRQLLKQGLVYPCICTRKSLAATPVYPNYCRTKSIQTDTVPHALRLLSKAVTIGFDDGVQGQQLHAMAQQHGDFIVQRKDRVIAYQLAVVIDDFRQKISHVVRGSDLLESTPKQLFLQQLLGYPSPAYCHLPMLVDAQGNKLSKQTLAPAVATKQPEKTLFLLLTLLKQNPPLALKDASVATIMQWAIEHWKLEPLKKIRAIKSTIG